MLVLDDVSRLWAAETDLRHKALRWTWFDKAFAEVMASLEGSTATSTGTNEDSLSKAFFDWVQAVESYEAYEALDRLDFSHFITGLLLQKLVAAQPPVLELAASRESATLWPAGKPLTVFVLTLLQAWRLNAGAAPFVINEVFLDELPWASYLENLREDSSTAICFLDQMTGLKPVWQSPSLIESRPAIQAVLESRRKAG